MGVRYGITEKTARLFMLKIREAMSAGENHPMKGIVQVDGLVHGHREQGERNPLPRSSLPMMARSPLINGNGRDRLYLFLGKWV